MKIKPFLLSLITAGTLLYACDSFQEDVAPRGEDELTLKNAMVALPNTTLYIDLKKSIRSSEAVNFSLLKSPEKGTATISTEAILKYEPNPGFLNGSDYLTLNLLNVAGESIDIDSLYINMAASVDSIPCFNGALTDYYTAYSNQSIAIFPLENDGYCVENTSGAIIDFLEEPEHGQLIQQDLFSYLYTPDQGFIGNEHFMYELTLVDKEGNEYYSIAEINVVVNEWMVDYQSCDTLIRPFIHKIDTGLLSAPYGIILFQLDPFFCGSNMDYKVDILNVEHGTVEPYPGFPNMINYYPGNSYYDKVSYKVTFSDDHIVSSYMEILIEDSPLDSCLKSSDDHYDLKYFMDHTYTLEVLENDMYCNSVLGLRIIDEPIEGIAWVDQSLKIIYALPQMTQDSLYTSLSYELCTADGCDTANVHLNILN